jgi:hypothetical protein
MRISSRFARPLAAASLLAGAAITMVGAAAPAGARVWTTNFRAPDAHGTVGVPFAIVATCDVDNGDSAPTMVVHAGPDDYTLGTATTVTVDYVPGLYTRYEYSGTITPRTAGGLDVTITCAIGADSRYYNPEFRMYVAAGEPTTTTIAPTTTTVAVTPTTQAQVLGDQLANTGARRATEPMLLIGGAMVCIGALFVVSTPRRRGA